MMYKKYLSFLRFNLKLFLCTQLKTIIPTMTTTIIIIPLA